jgi:hypothetical protein
MAECLNGAVVIARQQEVMRVSMDMYSQQYGAHCYNKA